MLRSFIRLGIHEDFEPWLKDRIMITNKTFLWLMLVVTLNLVNSLANNVPLVITYLIAAYPIGILAEALIYFGYNRAGRVLLSIIPVFVGSILQGVFQSKGGAPNAAVWGYIVLFQITPFVLLAPREKTAKRIAVIFNLVMALGYEFFNRMFETDAPIALEPEQTFISIVVSLVAVLGLLQTIDGLFIQFQSNTQQLVNALGKEKEEQKEAQAKLNKTLEDLNTARISDEKQNWVNTSFAELLSLLRREMDTANLYDLIVPFVVKAVKANQGGLFLYFSEQDELRLTSAYAYERKKYVEKKIQSGQGLVWECFLEKNNILLKQVPENYAVITSGLGEATPRCVLLLALTHQDQAEGVLELASFQVFEKHHIDFLSKASEAIGSFIANERISARTKILLEHSQATTEHLRSQEEELKQTREELKAAQEEIARKKREIEKLSMLGEPEWNR